MASPRNRGKGKGAAWLRAHVSYHGNDCLPWPFFRDPRVGRGRVGFEGHQYWAHRLMCEWAHGEPPTPKHQAAHECGKGHYGCVNPRHLRWKTNSENQIDRRRNGNMLRNGAGQVGNLRPDQQASIIALKGKKTQVEIAAIFGVSLGCVQYWHKYKATRGHGPCRVFTQAENDCLQRHMAAGATFKEIAAVMTRTESGLRKRASRIKARSVA